MNKPFYFALFSKEYVYVASLLQSIYTWFGSQWENFAEIVASERFRVVEKRYPVRGTITPAEQSRIDTILKDLESGKRKPGIDSIKEELQAVFDENDEHKEVQVTVDFYIVSDDLEEYFFELKTVKPNKNEMRSAQKDSLDILAIKQKERSLSGVHTMVVFPYNPYYSDEYQRWTVVKFFRRGQDLLIGKEFWDFLGGDGTYEDLLGLFREIGHEALNRMEKVLARVEESSAVQTQLGVHD